MEPTIRGRDEDAASENANERFHKQRISKITTVLKICGVLIIHVS